MSGDVGKDLIKMAESFGETYTNSIISRTFVTAIPWVGGPIDVALSGDAARRWQSRCNEFFEELKNRCQKLNEDKIDKDFLESDEFIALLTDILESLRKAHEIEKIARFINILLRSSEKNHSGDYYKERYIRLVDETSEAHILILELFRSNKLYQFGRNILTSKAIAQALDMDKAEVEAFCSDLVARGLLVDPTIGSMDYARGSYALHDSAIKFFDFLFE